jgi:hypothetical protein
MEVTKSGRGRHTIEKTSQNLNKWHWRMIEMRYAGASHQEIFDALNKEIPEKYTFWSIQRYFSIGGYLYDAYNQYVKAQSLNRMAKAKVLFEAEVEVAAGFIIKKLKEAIEKDDTKLALELSREVLNRVNVFDSRNKPKDDDSEGKEAQDMSIDELVEELEKNGITVNLNTAKGTGKEKPGREVSD